MSARVCVVVLNWNQPAMTRRCLDHVRALTDVSFDVLVIDNGSRPENRAQLERECGGDCELMLLPTNLGFAGGMNRGIERALAGGSEFVWLLNNDAFPEPDCLARLVGAMDADPSLGAVTPRLTDERGAAQTVGAVQDFRNGRQSFFTELVPPKSNEPGVVLIGAALLVRTAIMAHVGVLDERFFAYREDDDLCYRVTRMNGGYLGYVHNAVSIHLEGGSGGGKSAMAIHMVTRNGWLIQRRYGARAGRVAPRLRYIAHAVADAGYQALAGRRDLAHAQVTGLLAAFSGRYGAPRGYKRRTLLTRFVLAKPYYLANAIFWLADCLDSRRVAV